MGISYSRKAEGVAQVCGPFGELFDVKTVTCAHGDRIMYGSPFGDGTEEVKLPEGIETSIVAIRREPPAVCHQCWSLVCPKCHKHGRCTPLLKRVEEEYQKRKLFEAVGI